MAHYSTYNKPFLLTVTSSFPTGESKRWEGWVDNPLADNQELILGLGCSLVVEHLIALHAQGPEFIPAPTQDGLIVCGFQTLPSPTFPAHVISCNSFSSWQRFSMLGRCNRHSRDCLGYLSSTQLSLSNPGKGNSHWREVTKARGSLACHSAQRIRGDI